MFGSSWAAAVEIQIHWFRPRALSMAGPPGTIRGRLMTCIRTGLAIAAVALACAASLWVADASEVINALRETGNRQKLDEIIASAKASGDSDGRISVTDKGTCSDGMPTCYDGPSNTIIIAGDPTKYLYKTK